MTQKINTIRQRNQNSLIENDIAWFSELDNNVKKLVYLDDSKAKTITELEKYVDKMEKSIEKLNKELEFVRKAKKERGDRDLYYYMYATTKIMVGCGIIFGVLGLTFNVQDFVN